MASIGTCDSMTERGRARLPTTTTRSSSSTAISTSKVVVVPAATSTALRTTVENPDSVNVTSCMPAGSAPIVNRPAASVTTVHEGPSAWAARTPPATSMLRASTVTPGRTKPVVSVTVPDTKPFCCAKPPACPSAVRASPTVPDGIPSCAPAGSGASTAATRKNARSSERPGLAVILVAEGRFPPRTAPVASGRGYPRQP